MAAVGLASGQATYVHAANAKGSTTYYVSPTGMDAKRCPAHTSPSKPLKTITFALGCAADRDTISAAAGTYAENLNISKSITLTGAGPSSTTIDGRAAGKVVTVGGGITVTIANLKVTNGSNAKGAGIGNSGTLALSNLVVTANTGVGVEIDGGTASLSNVDVNGNTGDGVVVGGESGAPSAALTLGGAASQVNSNGGEGVVVNPTGSLSLNVTVSALSDPRLAITSNGLDGLLIRGAASASGFEAGSNTNSGVVIDTGQAVRLNNFEIDHNGADGILVKKADGTQFVTQGDRPTVRSLSLIHDNTGNGVTIGDAAADINGTVGSTDIYGNQIGLSVEDQGLYSTKLDLVQDDVYTNSQNGFFIRPADVTFNGNRVHNNGLNQVVFDGGGVGFSFTMDSFSGSFDATVNAIYCYAAKSVFGIWAQNIANVTVRHTSFEGGGAGLKDYGYESGSSMAVSDNATAITVCP
jgi:hypothetical protein